MNAVSYETELKAAMTEWMILDHDYLPLPATPDPRNRGGKKGQRTKVGN